MPHGNKCSHGSWAPYRLPYARPYDPLQHDNSSVANDQDMLSWGHAGQGFVLIKQSTLSYRCLTYGLSKQHTEQSLCSLKLCQGHVNDYSRQCKLAARTRLRDAY